MPKAWAGVTRQHRQQGCGLQAHGAGKTQVVLGHAKGLGRGHQYARAAAYLQGHRFSGEGVGPDGAGGSVLFGGAQRHDHPLAALQIRLHLGPAAQLQTNGIGAGGGLVGRGHRVWLRLNSSVQQ